MSDTPSLFHPTWGQADLRTKEAQGAITAFLSAGLIDRDGGPIVALRQDFYMCEGNGEHVVAQNTIIPYALHEDLTDPNAPIPRLRAVQGVHDDRAPAPGPDLATALGPLLIALNRDHAAAEALGALPYPWFEPEFIRALEGRYLSLYHFRDFTVACQEYPATFTPSIEAAGDPQRDKEIRASYFLVLLPEGRDRDHEGLRAHATLRQSWPLIELLYALVWDGQATEFPLAPIDPARDRIEIP